MMAWAMIHVLGDISTLVDVIGYDAFGYDKCTG